MAEATFGRGNRQGRGNLSNYAAQRMHKRDDSHMNWNKFSNYDRQSHMNWIEEEVNMPSKKLRRDRHYGDQSCFTDAESYRYERRRGSRDIAGPDSFTVRSSFPRTDSSGNNISQQSVIPNTRYHQDDRHEHEGTHTSGSSGRWYMFISPLNSEATNLRGNTEEHLDSPVTGAKESPSSGNASICVEDTLAPCRHTMADLKTNCEQEEDPELRQTLLNAWQEHEKLCYKFLLQPTSHPKHDIEYRKYCEQQTKIMTEAGTNPHCFDYQQGWKIYWPGRMSELIRESWETKVGRCLRTECNLPTRKKHIPINNKAEKEKVPVKSDTEPKRGVDGAAAQPVVKVSLNDKTEKEEITKPKSETEGASAPRVSEINLNNPVCDKDEKEDIPVNSNTELKSETGGSMTPPISEVILNNPVINNVEREEIPVNSNTERKGEADGTTASPASKVIISEEFRHNLRRLYVHIKDRRIRIKTAEKAEFYLRGQKHHISSEWKWEARLVKPNEIVGMNISRWWTNNIPPSIEKFTPEGTLIAISRHGNFGHNSECSPGSKDDKVCKNLSEVSNNSPENKSCE